MSGVTAKVEEKYLQENYVEDVQKHHRSNSPISYVSSSSEDDAFTSGKSTNRHSMIPPVDPSVIIELEEQAKITSKSLSKVMRYLAKSLKETTETTTQTVETYDSTIDHVQSEVEKNIRSMYGLIAKCEELDRKMKPVNELANQVSSITEMLDDLELLCKTS